MPLLTESPIAIRMANVWQITAFSAFIPPDPTMGPSMQIELAIGYREPEEAIIWHERKSIIVEPAALVQVYSSAPAHPTLYGSLKIAMYAYLQQAGHIPANAIEVTP